MVRIALLGDSIFDNKAYVGTAPDVIGHLRHMSPKWEFDLHAVDGNFAGQVLDQVKNIENGVSYLVVSAGGNDAINNADILQLDVSSSAVVLASLADRATRFADDYLRMLSAVAETGKPFAISTVYYPNFPDVYLQKITKAALASFNDVIISLGAQFRVPILDLRLVCTEPSDYANEIEPSGTGGRKIANAIIRMLERRQSGEQGCVVHY